MCMKTKHVQFTFIHNCFNYPCKMRCCSDSPYAGVVVNADGFGKEGRSSCSSKRPVCEKKNLSVISKLHENTFFLFLIVLAVEGC